jgi:hypothetical protein
MHGFLDSSAVGLRVHAWVDRQAYQGHEEDGGRRGVGGATYASVRFFSKSDSAGSWADCLCLMAVMSEVTVRGCPLAYGTGRQRGESKLSVYSFDLKTSLSSRFEDISVGRYAYVLDSCI